ncbi:LemA family protein [Paenibacillus psychroresistens]|uniref:LemA family protein n=1 Tax=Paenibacillus psychroresistens TaxID=1778678 RepID=A0A6B8RPV6_9BACL|nr:LemA family protein [Paenibacillus psychroresistens]QGQ97877.1 LemA family protein [Paenibacillus psychroresistens]
MKRSMIIWIALGAVLLIIIFSAIGSYNGLVTSETAVENKFSQIDVDLERRANLIPNLVSTVKGYAAHEKEVLDNIAKARTSLIGAQTPDEKAQADTQLTGALSRLLVIVENYPNLKADVQFKQLMDQLEGTENRIAVSRKDYNDAVSTYNIKIRSFPASISASLFGFEKKPFFNNAPGTDQVPEVKF